MEKNNWEKFITCPPLCFTLSTNLMYFFLIWKSADLNSLSVTNLRYGVNGEEEREKGEEVEGRREGEGRWRRERRRTVRRRKKRGIRICIKKKREEVMHKNRYNLP
jgi:hypothetical protein